MDWTTVDEQPKKKVVPLKDYKLSNDDYSHGASTGPSYGSGGPRKTTSTHTGPIYKKDSTSGGAYMDQEAFEEIKYEIISHTCAEGVKKARAIKDLSQGELAKKINVKVSVIHDVENGTAQYNADLINLIEKATGCKVDRGRKQKKKAKKSAY